MRNGKNVAQRVQEMGFLNKDIDELFHDVLDSLGKYRTSLPTGDGPMGEDQLAACENGAPLMVSEYRKLLTAGKIVTDAALETKTQSRALAVLCSRLIHTIRSGIIAASNVEEMTTEARRLGVYK